MTAPVRAAPPRLEGELALRHSHARPVVGRLFTAACSPAPYGARIGRVARSRSSKTRPVFDGRITATSGVPASNLKTRWETLPSPCSFTAYFCVHVYTQWQYVDGGQTGLCHGA